VKECSEFFYERLVDGGVIVYDDYCSPSCPGAKLAVDEFAVGKDAFIPEIPPDGVLDYAVIKKNVENRDG
jgi:O-methyltransferase